MKVNWRKDMGRRVQRGKQQVYVVLEWYGKGNKECKILKIYADKKAAEKFIERQKAHFSPLEFTLSLLEFTVQGTEAMSVNRTTFCHRRMDWFFAHKVVPLSIEKAKSKVKKICAQINNKERA